MQDEGNPRTHAFLKRAFPDGVERKSDAEWALARWCEQRLKANAGRYEETDPKVIVRPEVRPPPDPARAEMRRRAARIKDRRRRRMALQSELDRAILAVTRQTATTKENPDGRR